MTDSPEQLTELRAMRSRLGLLMVLVGVLIVVNLVGVVVTIREYDAAQDMARELERQADPEPRF